MKCQNKYLGARWYYNNKEKSRESNRRHRANPVNWENEKERARIRNKTEESLEYFRVRSRWFRSGTVHGRVISLNAHVHSRGQSKLSVDWHDVLDKFGELELWCCNECSTKEQLSFDHIVEFQQGGEHTIDNLQILCKSCNTKKGLRIRWNKDQLVI